MLSGDMTLSTHGYAPARYFPMFGIFLDRFIGQVSHAN